MNYKTALLGLSSAVVLAALAGCGGSTVVGNSTNPRIRVVDAISSPTNVTASVNGQSMSGISTIGTSSTYQIFTNGNRNVSFNDATSGNQLVQQSPLFRLNSFYTAIGYNSANGYDILVLNDSGDTSDANAAVRFAKVAVGSATNVDVYVTTPGADLTNLQPNFPSVSLGSSAVTYQSFPSGTYEVRETAVGSKTALVDQTLTLNGSTAYTILDAGQSTYLLLQDQ